MTVIEASAVRVQTMADGTLRLVVDIQPTNAQSAFRMFGSPGTPVALARLKTKPEQHASEAPKGGPLARLAGQWCQLPTFWAWAGVADAEAAAAYIREACGVQSRALLDHNADAAASFHTIREAFAEHLKETQ